MRVHPTLVNTSGAKWHLPAVIFFLVAFVFYNVSRGGDQQADAAPVIPRESVLVAKILLEKGAPIPEDAVALEPREIATLPSDVIKSIDDIVGLQPIGPIPAGYPLAKALLEEPGLEVEVTPVKAVEKPKPQIDPIEEKLKLIRERTVAVTLTFQSLAPPRGSRVAISLQSRDGKTSELVAEQAWIEHSNGQSTARIRVAPHLGLFLSEARSLGVFTYIEIGDKGRSPYEGRAITDINELKDLLSPKIVQIDEERLERVREKEKEQPIKLIEEFKGFAWTGGERFVISDEGKLYTVDGMGVVTPLHKTLFARQENFQNNLDAPHAAALQPNLVFKPKQDEPALPEADEEEGLKNMMPLVGLSDE